ncbi:hypothetical protein AVEN_161603-1 [Araneus ventricosus]|uniref:Uncharacterized protein n=1 Tax=Araneus ventricosus TaxID=182803 RepID=A0A4Y2FQU9_ARAVE|nr:hypothetical protein AVEN_161603-1 [Araneus ventricosus]
MNQCFRSFPVKLDLHHNTTLFHLDQRPICFPPIQVDNFRQLIYGCFKAHDQLLSSPPTPTPVNHHSPPPHKGDFPILERVPSPPHPHFPSLTHKHISRFPKLSPTPTSLTFMAEQDEWKSNNAGIPNSPSVYSDRSTPKPLISVS